MSVQGCQYTWENLIQRVSFHRYIRLCRFSRLLMERPAWERNLHTPLGQGLPRCRIPARDISVSTTETCLRRFCFFFTTYFSTCQERSRVAATERPFLACPWLPHRASAPPHAAWYGKFKLSLQALQEIFTRKCKSIWGKVSNLGLYTHIGFKGSLNNEPGPFIKCIYDIL